MKDSSFIANCYQLLCGSVYLDHNNIHIKLLIANAFEEFQNEAFEILEVETRKNFSAFLGYLRKNYFKSDGRFFLGKFSNYADLCNKPVFSNNGSGEGLQTNSTIFYNTYLENYHASGQKPLYNYSG